MYQPTEWLAETACVLHGTQIKAMPRHLQGSWEAMCCRQNPPLMDDGASTQVFPKHLDTHLPWEFTMLDFKQLTERQP